MARLLSVALLLCAGCSRPAPAPPPATPPARPAPVTPTAPAPADDTVAAFVEKLGGNVERDEGVPGKSVTRVDLTGTKVAPEDLKQPTALRSLNSLFGSSAELVAHCLRPRVSLDRHCSRLRFGAHPRPEQRQARAPVHGALHALEPVHLAFHRPVTPRCR
jgi:hypothetical protein